MAKFPLDLSKFKKVKSDKDSTTLAHPDGHSIIVAHKALSPKMRGQMADMPAMSEGGEAKDPTQRHLLPGDKTPNAIEKHVVSDAKKRMAAGGEAEQEYNVPKPPKPKPDARMQPADSSKRMMSDGGNTDDIPEPNKKKAAEFVKGFTKQDAAPSPAPESKVKDQPYGYPEGYKPDLNKGGAVVQKYAEGTPAGGASQDTPDQIVQDAAAQAPQPEQPKADDNFNRGPGGATFSFDKFVLNHPDTAPIASQTAALNNLSANETAQDFAKQQSAQAIKDQVDAYNQAATKQGLPPKPYPPGILDSIPQPGDQSGAAPAPTPASAPQPPQQDPMLAGSDQFAQNSLNAIGEQRQGVMQEAAAQGEMGRQQAAALKNSIGIQQEQANSFQKHYADLEGERQHWINDLETNKIDASHYVDNMSTGKKIATGIGMILGGFGAAAGQANGAASILQANIDRDIDAQKANLGTTKSLLESNLRQFGNLRDATDQTRAMQMDVVSNQLKKAAATATDPIARARALQSAGQLDMQSAQIIQQTAMRRAIFGNGAKGPAGQWDPTRASRVINMSGYVPDGQRAQANKELQDAQNAVALRENTLRAFDEVAKLNTVANNLSSPIQNQRRIAGVMGPALDKLTKDTSGRVTPETVKLVQGIFSKMGNDQKTNVINRASLQNMLSQGMHYPLLDSYGISPANANTSRPPEMPKIAPKK